MRRHFEICIFSYVAAELKSGDICVFNSEAYADYREHKRFGDYLIDLDAIPPALEETLNLGF